ncbi:MAG: bifunctional phosphoglucose/phosphomannose isomerase [Actinomycetes bacterium]
MTRDAGATSQDGPATAAGLGPELVAEFDAGDMLGAIAGLPRQLTAGYAVARERLAGAFAGAGSGAPPARPTGLAVFGMGGSAIGADLVLAATSIGVPAAVVRGYDIPAWIGPETLAIAASYSGETEETLACAALALERGCAPVCVASGGTLAALASERGLPLVTIPGGGQPRASVGYLAMPILAALSAAGLTVPADTDVAEAAELLRAGNTQYGPDSAGPANEAKALAARLHKRQAVVYGAGLTGPAARRWKGQINENAKAPAFWNELPELDHNELMGWTSLPHVAAASLAVFLEDAQSDERLRRRAALTAGELEARGVGCAHVAARGASRLARLFSLVQLGDYASFYLALLYGVDPTPVGVIQDFKAKLAGGAGG